jgi:hypothetical protein
VVALVHDAGARVVAGEVGAEVAGRYLAATVRSVVVTG